MNAAALLALLWLIGIVLVLVFCCSGTMMRIMEKEIDAIVGARSDSQTKGER